MKVIALIPKNYLILKGSKFAESVRVSLKTPNLIPLYSFFRTYCCYCRPSRLKAPGTRDYKFGSGNSPAIRTHNGMNIPRRSTLRSQFYPVTLKRSYSLGEIHLAATFLPPFFLSTSFFKSLSLTRGPESFIRASLLVSSSYYCGNPSPSPR